ncbi:MAG: efflux RND transporter permease subunit [Hyphomonadaceae bacterium]|nr:efflux RND transporter permease subunit [Hyphomonadaceae bacterium]
MALNISAGAIRNPIPPIVLILALMFAGLTAYFRLPINQIPNVEFGAFNVTVAQPGAAPSDMETQISQRVEAALTAVQGVKRVTTTVSPGVSDTFVELESNADLSRAVDDARDAINRIRVNLPADITDPVITRVDAAAEPVAYYVVQRPGATPQELSWFIDNDLQRELLAVPGVSQIPRMGGVNREVRIDLDPARLQAFGISADQVSAQLRAENADLPGGQAQVGGQAQSIRTLGGATSVEALSQTRITAADGRVARLVDLGTVSDGAADMASVARYNGQPVVGFMVQRSKGSSEVRVFEAVEKKLKDIEKRYPGTHFQMTGTSVHFTMGMHESSTTALLEGALLACLVVFLILRDWRATLIAAAAIPLSILPTFAVIEALGFTLNMMTLIALALVSGVLVDDAIVEIENIVRHMRMGKSPYEAALEAADEIGLAVVATSATIIAVFTPVAFMTGEMGVWFREFGLTVAIAAFFSLVVARLITPMMAAYFLKDKHQAERRGSLAASYEGILKWAIGHPWATVGAGIGVFVLSIVMATQVPFTVIPRFDNNLVLVRVEPPPGTPILDADRTVQGMARELRQFPEVQSTYTSVDGPDGAASQGSIFVRMVPRTERERSSYEMQQVMRPTVTRFADYRTSFVQFQGGGAGADVTVQFVGQDPAAVNAAGDRLVARMRQMDSLADVKSSAALQRPELRIRPRPEDMARLGVTSATLASAVRIATSGDVEQNLARFDLADRQIPIRVTIRPDQRADLDTIRMLPVRSTLGAPVRLDAVADVDFALGQASIERLDRERSVTITANVVKGELGTAQRAVTSLPEAKPRDQGGLLPASVRLANSGSTEEVQEMFATFGSAMLWGVILIYGVLVLLFRDFFQPITIMTALPLSIGGAFAGLMIANQPLSLFALIGLLMLMGLVTKNSILLVDFAVEQMHAGVSRNKALIDAGVKRSRPIVMTTLAMSGGMVPAAAGWGIDGTLRQGMGVAVIGGLLLSTLLSLVFVPAMFVLVDRLERFVTPFFSRLTTRGDEASRYPAE